MWIDALALRECEKQYFRKIWVPQKPIVVLGSSNQIETEVHADACEQDGTEILKRSGGGGTVVLYPGCVILTLGAWVNKPFSNQLYFGKLNAAVIKTLSRFSERFVAAEQSGISDLSIDGKKFAGTSLFRSREFLMYQASLIVDCDIAIIDRYLKHPSKEPEYRMRRKHSDFLVGLSQLDSKTTPENLSEFFERNFDADFASEMRDELTAVNKEHVPYLLNRAIS